MQNIKLRFIQQINNVSQSALHSHKQFECTGNSLFTRIVLGFLLSLTWLATPSVAFSAERVEVTIANDSTTRVNITGSFDTIDSSGRSTLSKKIYTVPRGKRLLIEYSSVEMDANIDNPSAYDFAVYTYLRSTGRQGGNFLLGTLTQGPDTSRGPPYFYLAKATPMFVNQLNPVFLQLENKHANVGFTFARVSYAFSCRLVDIR